jgi:hypothetical protein
MSKEEKKSSEIDFLDFQILTPEGAKKFIELVNSDGFDSKNHHIPSQWLLRPVAQKGPCCGIYMAVDLAGYSGLSSEPIPPARKADLAEADLKENKEVESLRNFAKKNHLTGFGALFNRESFSIFAKRLKMKETEQLKLPTTEPEYIKKICNTLESGKAVIISADVLRGFPTRRNVEGAHWALIFGYIYLNGVCHFLVSQYGGYYLWNAPALFQSNKKMPFKNSFCGTYVKKDKNYVKIGELDKKSCPSGTKFYKIEETSLTKFRFSGFAASALPLKNKVTDFSTLLESRQKLAG